MDFCLQFSSKRPSLYTIPTDMLLPWTAVYNSVARDLLYILSLQTYRHVVTMDCCLQFSSKRPSLYTIPTDMLLPWTAVYNSVARDLLYILSLQICWYTRVRPLSRTCNQHQRSMLYRWDFLAIKLHIKIEF